ncbi:hypothetical protein AB0I77_51475 [Streptomyces sp. NPDC050619]|uniref:hypothetical protein n=1 Tax=Streptomyces sp. NPDC050619 TaxID=3157214 RepID=UPI00342E184D
MGSSATPPGQAPAPTFVIDLSSRATASQLGEHAGLLVLPLFAVLTLDAGAGQLGVLRAVGQAPILLLSLFVGP